MDTDTRLRLEGNWDKFKGRVRETWGDITNDELDQTEGNFEKVVGTIKEKTGEAISTVKAKLQEFMDELHDDDTDQV